MFHWSNKLLIFFTSAQSLKNTVQKQTKQLNVTQESILLGIMEPKYVYQVAFRIPDSIL